VSWRNFDGDEGAGRRTEVVGVDSALFWFFDPNNWELLVKVLDGCQINQRYWVFSAATTNVEYTLRVRDATTGRGVAYTNPSGQAAAAITDTDAFAECRETDPARSSRQTPTVTEATSGSR
jgi:hypothetical protein